MGKDKFMAESAINETKALPWGLWPTLGFSAVISVVFIIIHTVVLAVFAVFLIPKNPQADIEAFIEALTSNGLCLSVSTITSAVVCTALVVLFIRLRKGLSVKDYLGFKKPSKKGFIKWLALLAVLMVFSDGLSYILNRPIVPSYMIDVYKTASLTPLLYIALLLMAPVFEEVFFRGFLFQGIRYSRLGPAGAVALTSIYWSAIHLQYDAYGILNIFVVGILFGIARLKTDSIYVTIAMHSLQNLVATIEVVIHINLSGTLN